MPVNPLSAYILLSEKEISSSGLNANDCWVLRSGNRYWDPEPTCYDITANWAYD
jgi:hypothetical protein